MNRFLLIALILIAGCLGSGAEQGENKVPSKSVATENKITIALSPEEVVLMQGSDVTHKFVLTFQGPAPSKIKVRPEGGYVKITVRPEEIEVTDGKAKGEIIFASPPSYLVGDQSTKLMISDPSGKPLGEVKIDFYVLPPGAS